MTKLILSIPIIAALLYIASPKLTLKPFSLSFTNGWFALGIILIGIGIGLIRYQGYKESAKKGVDTAFKIIHALLKKENNASTNI